MKYLFPILFLSLALSAQAVDRVIATLTVTNAAGTTNGQTLTVSGNVRTWTNNVFIPSSQVLTNDTAAKAKTNLLNHISLNPFAQVIAQDVSAAELKLTGVSGLTLTVTPSAGWATVAYTTQAVASVVGVRVPITAEPIGGTQTNIASLLVSGIGALSTNSFYESNIAVSNLVGITNAQTISGVKQFTNTAGIWYGYVSNATGISGSIVTITNGVWRNGILISPTMTNGVNYGNAFQSPGSGEYSEQIGTDADASGLYAAAFGHLAIASGIAASSFGYISQATGNNSTAYGAGAFARANESSAFGTSSLVPSDAPYSQAIGPSAVVGSTHTNSTAIGSAATTTAKNQVRLGTASEYVSIPGGLIVEEAITNILASGTNTFPAGSDIAFGRYALTTIANGANSISVGTNVFAELSGNTAAFTINGITGSPNRDGKMIVLLNQTTYNMTISHDSGTEPTAANRIFSMTGADRATTGNGSAMLIYSSAASRWILISLDQ